MDEHEQSSDEPDPERTQRGHEGGQPGQEGEQRGHEGGQRGHEGTQPGQEGEPRGFERAEPDPQAHLDPQQDFEEEEEGEEDEGALESVTIEISGLSIYTHHGVSSAEREVGQRLVLDLRLELGESDATATDEIEDTVDYAEVCQLVTLVAQQRSHRTLERLCSSIADRLISDYDLEGVWVKATKPEPPIPLPVEEVSVEVWREPGE
jgi:7,8-dihydroneopterin aldolase/epimerase/oxygenase